MAWTVNFEPRALAELKKLDPTAQKRIVKFLEGRPQPIAHKIVAAAKAAGVGKEEEEEWNSSHKWLGRITQQLEHAVVCRVGRI